MITRTVIFCDDHAANQAENLEMVIDLPPDQGEEIVSHQTV